MPASLMKYLILIVLLFPIAAHSQTGNKTLLWRITGKGLQKPSYLYGTLHLKEKRIFRFDDSMYAAIAATDGLAIELNMNELMGYYINKLLDEKADDKKVKDLLTDEELEKLKEPLAKKFKKDFKDITTKDIIKEKNKWLSDYMMKGEMPTFIDAYLYDLALHQGKWLGGIEDVEDQMALIDGSDLNQIVNSDSSFSMDAMINTYINQDLDGIDRMMNGYDTAYRRSLLTTRNVKMARRMDSLSAQRSMFFAVGAAHLPGDSGVIHLLRARGFTVEPVFSNKRIFSKDYKYTQVPVQWQEVAGNDSSYTISMPGTPASIKMYGLIDMKFLLDLGNLSGYCAMGFVSPGADDGDNDSLYEAMARKVFDEKKARHWKRIVKDGVKGVEYLEHKDTYIVRMQLLRSHKNMYMLWVYGQKEAYLKSDDADRFFNSLKVLEPRAKEGASYVFADSMLGITFVSPVKLEHNMALVKQNAVKGWDLAFFTGQDKASGAYVLITSKQVQAGNYIPNDSAILEDISKYFMQKYKMTKAFTMIDGYRAVRLDGASKEVYMQAISTVRGNKNVSVMLVSQGKAKDPELLKIFSTLAFIPYPQSKPWKTIADVDRTYSTTGPAPFVVEKPDPKEADQDPSIYTFDTTTATSYHVYVDTLSKYAWGADEATFLKGKIKNYYTKADSVVEQKMAVNGSDRAIEVLLNTRQTNVYKRIRLVLHGKLLTSLTAAGDRTVITSTNSNLYFDNFVTNGPISFSVAKDKSAMMFGDLKSKDSVTRQEAYNAISRHVYEKQELPMLHKALFEKYEGPWKWSQANTVNQEIANEVALLKDESTPGYIGKHYAELTGNKTAVRSTVLSLLAEYKTKESYRMLAALMNQAPPAGGNDYFLSYKLSDSLLLLKEIFPELRKLLPDTSVGMMIAGLAATLYDTGMIDSATLQQYGADLVALGTYHLPALSKNIYYDIHADAYIKLLGKINSDATAKMLVAFLSVTNDKLRESVAMQLVEHGRDVPGGVLDSLAAMPLQRAGLYEDLRNLGKEKLFPDKYLTQKAFAEAAMSTLANDGEDVNFIAAELWQQNQVEVDGNTYNYYLYKVTFEEGKDTVDYLGVAGAYDGAAELLDPKKNQTGIYYKERFSEDKLPDLFKSYMDKQRDEETTE